MADAMSAKGQQRTHAPQQRASLFDHLVGAGEQRRRDFNTERFRGLEIEPKQILGGPLNCGRAVRRSPTRNNVPTKPKRAPADIDLKKENAALRRELAEALEQQTAKSEVLQVISSTPGDFGFDVSEPKRDVEGLFRQQFRRDIRDGRFTMDLAQSADCALKLISNAAGVSLTLARTYQMVQMWKSRSAINSF